MPLSQVLKMKQSTESINTWHQDLAWIRKYLPHQGPLQYFVHHNPLAALESEDFARACQIAQEVYAGRSFLEQKQYLQALKQAKISQAALAFQLKCHLEAHGHGRQAFKPLLKLMLCPPPLSLKPLIEKALDTAPQQALIAELRTEISQCPSQATPHNPVYFPSFREVILAQTASDIDDQLNPALVKFLSAYADPGSAYWSHPDKSQGLWQACLTTYTATPLLESPFARQLARELKQLQAQGWSKAYIFSHYRLQWGLEPAEFKKYLLTMALRLRGWASLFSQLEQHPEQSLDQTDFALEDFLLVKLVFEAVACRQYLPALKREALIAYQALQCRQRTEQQSSEWLYLSLHYLKINQLIVRGRWLASPREKQQLISCLGTLRQTERLYLYQKSLERTYADQCMQAVYAAQAELAPAAANTPASLPEPIEFQYITCLDDREESLRRYLEAQVPGCETFGVAGYFEMNMLYQGPYEPRPRQLCPGTVPVDFYVRATHRTPPKAWRRRAYAQLFRGYATHSKVSGLASLLTLLFGWLSALPFALKIFFPGLEYQLRQYLKQHWLPEQAVQELSFVAEGQLQALTDAQAAQKIHTLLQSIGLTQHFSDWIYVVGHGSSSVNNPHIHAYHCGACGGSTGQANARVFAQLANKPEVRACLKQHHGLELPPQTQFVAGYHDTSQDQISWFAQELKSPPPERHIQHLKQIKQALADNALERAKKFHNISTQAHPRQVARRLAIRAHDLTEARPEYNHATNALCVIGRRKLTQKLFLDRRAFLCSYDLTQDPTGQILAQTLAKVMPVVAGINLEYYFSSVDPENYGCGSKLNHNISCNYAVMSGFASDLRLGLSRQMVEIHDPQRMLFLIESQSETVLSILQGNPQLMQLVQNHWVHLLVYTPALKQFYAFEGQSFRALDEMPQPRESADV